MATESKQHTPGPWTATESHKWLANTPRYKSSIRYGATNLGNSIAEVYLGGPGALNCDAESVNANARLIAASPDLLEALNRMLVSFAGKDEELCMECGEKVGSGQSCDTCYVIGKAIEAIRKATEPEETR
jgi:hypothetical protein